MSRMVISLSIAGIGAGVVKLNTFALRCSQEDTVIFEPTTLSRDNQAK